MNELANEAPIDTPMIDFTKLGAIIPNNGTLNLVVIKGKDDNITVIYAPKFKGKEDDNLLRPIKMEDTAANLTVTFETNIIDLSAKQRIYADDFKIRTEALDKAIEKQSTAAAAAPEKTKTTQTRTKTTSKAQDLLTMPENTTATSTDKTGLGEGPEPNDGEPESGDETGTDSCTASSTETKPEDTASDLFES